MRLTWWSPFDNELDPESVFNLVFEVLSGMASSETTVSPLPEDYKQKRGGGLRGPSAAFSVCLPPTRKEALAAGVSSAP